MTAEPSHALDGLSEEEREELGALAQVPPAPARADDDDDAVASAEERHPDGDLTEPEAVALLDLVLSADPPPLPTEWFRIDRLNAKIKLRALTDTELEAISDRAMRDPTRREKNQGITGRVRDVSRVQRLTVVEASVEPEFSNAQIREKYGTGEDAVAQWFVPGEIQRMADLVGDLSGWSENSVTRLGKP